MNGQNRENHGVSQFALWFGLLGGAVAWLVHLLSAYAIAEFGCVGTLTSIVFLTITAVAWMEIGVSLLTLLAAIAAVVVAYRSRRRLQAKTENEAAVPRGELFLARTGLITSILFVLVILVESVPIFFYLQGC